MKSLQRYKNPVTVSIGIPAYFAENNIYDLVHDLTMQKEKNIKIKEILVLSDGSKDDTVKNALKIKDARVEVINSKNRKGMALRFLEMISIFKGDAFLLLNDDIKLHDRNFLNKLVKPIFTTNNVGLISGNPQPVNPTTFVEKSGILTLRAYEEMRYAIRDGNNKHTCDGKVLLLTKRFAKSIKFPKDKKEMGNVDAFLYFSCIANGYLYRHVRNAIVWFKFPDNLKDYINLNIRNNSNFHILKKRFGNLVEKEYYVPWRTQLKALSRQFINNPVGSLFIFIIGKYCKFKAKKTYKSFSPTWEIVGSTKLLSRKI